jgi:hypothetical protein
MRLRTAIDHIVMTYREERIRIQITIGLAAAEPGRTQTVSHLIGVAVQRIAVGRAEGGNRVMGAKGEVTPRCQRTGPRTGQHRPIPPSATHAGLDPGLRKQLPDAIRTLLPLLELIESEFPSGLPLATLARCRNRSGECSTQRRITRRAPRRIANQRSGLTIRKRERTHGFIQGISQALHRRPQRLLGSRRN